MINQALRALDRRVKNFVARGVIKLVSDSLKIQNCQADLLSDEVKNDLKRIQEYGFSSVPLDGAECVVLFPSGNRDHGLVIATDDGRHRKGGLDAGDVAVYSSGLNFIKLQAADGKIYIEAPNNVIIKSDETIRLEGKQIELAATEKIKWDVAGRGYDYLPLTTNTWENCTVPGAASDCTSPTEHPPAGAD